MKTTIKLTIITLASIALASCSIVLRPPACTGHDHTWTPWQTVQKGDDFTRPIQERRCTTCGWLQSTAGN